MTLANVVARWRLLSGAYLAMLGGAVTAFLLISTYGTRLNAPPTALVSKAVIARASAPNALLEVLITIAVVMTLGALLGWCLRFFDQPAVIGEVVAGILLGPSLFGRLAPEAASTVLSPDVTSILGVVAQLGIILYMFHIGLDMNAGLLRGRSHAAIAMSHASIIVPFVLGSALALLLYPRFSTNDVSFVSFALFVGVSMSVTAFPVLARILTDRGLGSSQLGTLALTCAAVDDVTAWCMLAFVVAVVEDSASQIVWTASLVVVFVAAMLFAVRPIVRRMVSRFDKSNVRDQFAPALVLLLLSSIAAEAIGIHAIFGAFLCGVIIPHDSALARTLSANLETVALLLLPTYFAFTGMRTEVGLVAGSSSWLFFGLIVIVATVGKFGGTLAAAVASGIEWRQAMALGVLMNTRGLMELVVLNIGLDLGVVSPPLFAMMVLMALMTTFATTPALYVLGFGSFEQQRSARFPLVAQL